VPDGGSFPRRCARTQGYTLGQPRGFTVGGDGARVAFLRSAAGDDPVHRLYVLDVASGAERLAADPATLLGAGSEDLPAAERARRERRRERAGGIVAYGADTDLRVAAFALAGRLFVAELGGGGGVRELAAAGPVLDPLPDPGGHRVAYVTGGALHVAELGGGDHRLAGDEHPEVTWGLAEFIAAEELGRHRGYWWAPDGERLAVARVDTAPVPRWWLADGASPGVAPTLLAYPAAGTANADTRLAVVDLAGGRVEVAWDRAAFPYLVEVVWAADGPLTLLVQSRDQTRTLLLAADPASGATSTLREDRDPRWLEIVPGVPAWLRGGRLVWTVDDQAADTRRLLVDGTPVTPPGLQVRQVLGTRGDAVLVAASDEPAEQHVWEVPAGGPPARLTTAAGVHTAVAGGPVTVVVSASLDTDGTRAVVRAPGRPPATIASLAEAPAVVPRVTLLLAGERALRTALLLPAGPDSGGRLPVLLDPYGGPHVAKVVAARNAAMLTAQWFADQGFAVVMADGRGTPGRGPAWERALYRDLAGPVLDDQVDALHAVAETEPRLDLGRVAIRGWSFGGWLAALAVLRRPDVFHAAVAGAPVTDWRLYDTHYSERYLGHPAAEVDTYRRHALQADAAKLERPLLLIHGLADDNVVAAHTLRLSAALLAAGRPHTVLPLTGVTHMASQEVVAENLLHFQLSFLRAALGLA
jgi:dipeptidyl-peptidase-4